jgi:hypothetical protein
MNEQARAGSYFVDLEDSNWIDGWFSYGFNEGLLSTVS